jgi:anthranilate/para-aminobenzoate synthase component I
MSAPPPSGVTPSVDEALTALRGVQLQPSAAHVLVPLFVELIADLETPVSAFLKLRTFAHPGSAALPPLPLRAASAASPPPPPPPPPPAAAAGGSTYAFLLESVEGGERLARYSLVGFAPNGFISGSGSGGGGGGVVLASGAGAPAPAPGGGGGDPLAAVEAWLGAQQLVVPAALRGHLPAFTGGAVGYVGYDAVRHWEPRTAGALAAQEDSLGIPEAAFLLCDDLLVFDHVRHTIKVVAHLRMAAPDAAAAAAAAAAGDALLPRAVVEAAHADACARVQRICARLAGPLPAHGGDGGTAPSGPMPLRRAARGGGGGGLDFDAASNMGRGGYEAAVRSLKSHIVAGNIIQAVPSHRVEYALPPRVSAFDIYRHLRIVNPSPYMFFLDLGPDFQIVGASPETLVKVSADGTVVTHPIAGTRPRGATPEEDEALAVRGRAQRGRSARAGVRSPLAARAHPAPPCPAGRAAGRRQGARRARDARGLGPQRHWARGGAGQRARGRADAHRKVLARAAHCQRGQRAAGARPHRL